VPARIEFTNKQTNEIIELYSKKNVPALQLSKKFQVNVGTIKRVLREQNIPFNRHSLKRGFTVDENYFGVIDSEAKSYLLGFLYADGCVSNNFNISLSLQERDVEIILWAKDQLKISNKLHRCARSKENPNFQDQIKLSVKNRILFKDLCRLGCVPRKSLVLKFPTYDQVPSRFMRHFIRGYFDGDGSLGLYRIKRRDVFIPQLSIISSVYFCEELEKFIEQKLNLVFPTYKNKNHNPQTARVQIDGFRKVLQFTNWLYQDATIYLSRKFEKYQEIKAYYNKICLEKEKND